MINSELELYLNGIESHATQRAYRLDVAQFFFFLEVSFTDIKSVKQIQNSQVELFIDTLKKEKLASNTINRKIASNLNFFEFLVSLERISHNVWQSTERLEIKAKNSAPHITQEDIGKLLDAVEKNEEVSLLHQAILFTLFTTGIKKGELINLKIEDFLQEDDKSYIQLKHKSNKGRTKILLSLRCASRIERYLDELMLDKKSLKPSDWLFRPTKNPIDTENLSKQLNPKSVDYIVRTWWYKVGLGEVSAQSARNLIIKKKLSKDFSAKVLIKDFGLSHSSFTYYTSNLFQ